MRVLFLASQPFFEWRGSPIRLGFDAMSMAQNGEEVDFLTLPVGQRREIEGVRILRAPNLLGIKKIAIGPSLPKFFFDFVFLFQGLGLVCRNHYDILHGVEDAGFIALVLGRLARAKVVFEKHSDPASYHSKKGAMRLVMRAYAAVERFVMRHADAVIGTGPGLVEQVNKLAPETPAYHIPDIPSSLAEPDSKGVSEARAKLLGAPDGAPGAVVATYVGSFASYQGIDLLFSAIPLALRAAPALRVAIIGGTPEEIAERTAALEKEGLADRVAFVGKIPPDILPCYLSASDIVLSPRVAGINTPLKLLDYLKVGRAIVATDHPANRLILDESSALLTPLTPEAFAEGISSLALDPVRRAALGSRGRGKIDTFYNFNVFKSRLGDVHRGLAPAP